MTRGKGNQHKKRKQQKQKPVPLRSGRQRHDTTARSAVEDNSAELASFFDGSWRQSRSGAISGRGYHYQDAVGSWLAVLRHVGELDYDRLVPEGLEDLSCEGSAGWHVQAKSRQARVGDFPLSLAATHVLKAWASHRERRERGQSERLAVVFERPVAGASTMAWGVTLDQATVWSMLVTELRARAAELQMPTREVEAMLGETCVLVVPWGELDSNAAVRASVSTGLPPSVAAVVVLAVRAAVAEHADINAQVGWSDRRGLSRTDVDRLVTEVTNMVDREALEEAVRTGLCDPIDFETPLDDGGFYEGQSTQPGHIAAGLVVPRPLLADAVLAGLDSRRTVLVAGPSGVGKSAVVWMAAYVARHVKWYRVNRLLNEDIEPLMRLARGSGAGRFGTVGFVVDGVGVGALAAWDSLQRAVAGQPGLVALGSVREEDILPVETAGDSVIVRPRLDEEIAEKIHAALAARGATSSAHWLEAYESSEGLTLEYTHMLTQGRRLREVVGDQVRSRIRERRDMELAVVAPVAFAHRWGASLEAERLLSILRASAPEVKLALARLVDEHLVTISGEIVSGLHPLRSAALSEAVHEVPPPSTASTARAVVETVCVSHLAGFLGGALSDCPDLGATVVEDLAVFLDEPEWIGRLANALQGLRIADFRNAATRWTQVLTEHAVPVPLRSLTLDLALLDSELFDALDSRLVSAAQEIRSDPRRTTSPLRDDLLRRIGPERAAVDLEHCETAQDAISLLGALAGSEIELGLAADQTSSLASVVRSSSLEDLSSLVQAATAVSGALGTELVAIAGGEEAILDRILNDDPWIIDLTVAADGNERVLRGRRLHPSDRLNPNPERSIKDLAVLGLGCLPEVTKADLTTVWAGGIPMKVGDYEFAMSGLLREYVHGTAATQWNRARSNAALSMIAAESQTDRLGTGLDILNRTAHFLTDLATTWAVSRGRRNDVERLNRTRSELLSEIDTLAPAAPAGGESAMASDAIHGVAQGVVHNLASQLNDASGYPSLAAFVGDTLPKQLDDLEKEPWHLLGIEGTPASATQIRETLSKLHAVLAELAWGNMTAEAVAREARGAPPRGALDRAALLARRRADRRHRQSLSRLKDLALQQGVKVSVITEADPEAPATTWPPVRTALVVELEALTQLDPSQRLLANLLNEDSISLPDATIIPSQAGRTLRRFSATAFRSGKLFPDPSAAGDWLEGIPPAHPTPLTDAVIRAHQGLQELSALAYLSHQRQINETVQTAADVAASEWVEGLERVRSFPKDPVTEAVTSELERIAASVQAELDGDGTEASLAEAIARGTQDETDDFLQMTGLVAIAATWDVDPDAAQGLLASP